jgi:hypothetical protein
MNSSFNFQVGDVVEYIDKEHGGLRDRLKSVVCVGDWFIVENIEPSSLHDQYVRLSVDSESFWLFSFRLRLVRRQFKWGSIIVISSSD